MYSSQLPSSPNRNGPSSHQLLPSQPSSLSAVNQHAVVKVLVSIGCRFKNAALEDSTARSWHVTLDEVGPTHYDEGQLYQDRLLPIVWSRSEDSFLSGNGSLHFLVPVPNSRVVRTLKIALVERTSQQHTILSRRIATVPEKPLALLEETDHRNPFVSVTIHAETSCREPGAPQEYYSPLWALPFMFIIYVLFRVLKKIASGGSQHQARQPQQELSGDWTSPKAPDPRHRTHGVSDMDNVPPGQSQSPQPESHSWQNERKSMWNNQFNSKVSCSPSPSSMYGLDDENKRRPRRRQSTSEALVATTPSEEVPDSFPQCAGDAPADATNDSSMSEQDETSLSSDDDSPLVIYRPPLLRRRIVDPSRHAISGPRMAEAQPQNYSPLDHIIVFPPASRQVIQQTNKMHCTAC
eukprot:CAMPEP_0116829924 /NCGR_PEP_ID=MMETSP0418-20121206/4481_1 /TAXON_ID=1158023 /ORGANISM="Astrosyne radiata, Strain 13vi08-1A" /LENGTH=407 /DNA_ID=CAMNT_0004458977 /DNA_START=430 /DNA_END=1650 /DNA_ORIENTATION=-